MAAGKNTKGKTNNGGSQTNVQHHGLEALESRVLFSAAALVSDVPEPVNDAAAAIEVSLVPGERFDPTEQQSARDKIIGLTSFRATTEHINADDPEGSNPTPHPMPVPEYISDRFPKHQLEHGPGIASVDFCVRLTGREGGPGEEVNTVISIVCPNGADVPQWEHSSALHVGGYAGVDGHESRRTRGD